MSSLVSLRGERHVLAAYFQGGLADVAPDWFGGFGHGAVAQAIAAGAKTAAALESALIAAGLPSDLTDELVGAVESPVQVEPEVVAHVRQLAFRRRLATVTADRVKGLALTGASDLSSQIRGEVQEALDLVEGGSLQGGLAEQVGWYRQRRAGAQYGYRAAWPLFDRIFGPLASHRLFILLGRHGLGKSIWCLSLALDIARQGGKVVFNALDMGEERTFLRLLAAEVGVPFTSLWRDEMSSVEDHMVEEGLPGIEKLPLTITHVVEPHRFVARAEGADMIVVDYLQMMACNGYGSKTEEVTEIVRALKHASRGGFVLAVSQLSRDGDPYWAAAIEHKADIMARLLPASETNRRLINLVVEKHRDGPVGQIPYYFLHEVERAIELPVPPELEVRV